MSVGKDGTSTCLKCFEKKLNTKIWTVKIEIVDKDGQDLVQSI